MDEDVDNLLLAAELISIVFTLLKVITWIVLLYIAIKIANKYLKK